LSADEVVTVYEYIEQDNLPAFEMEFKVACWIDPGQDGSTNSLGVPQEPSWGPCVEDFQPVEARFLYYKDGEVIKGNWHDYDYFVDRWNLDIEFDVDELFEECAEQAEQRRIDHELDKAGL
jgi:hypothetical protein